MSEAFTNIVHGHSLEALLLVQIMANRGHWTFFWKFVAYFLTELVPKENFYIWYQSLVGEYVRGLLATCLLNTAFSISDLTVYRSL